VPLQVLVGIEERVLLLCIYDCCATLQDSIGRGNGSPSHACGAPDKENVDANGGEDGAGKDGAAGAAEETLQCTHADDGRSAAVAAVPYVKAFLQAAAIAKVALSTEGASRVQAVHWMLLTKLHMGLLIDATQWPYLTASDINV